MNKRDIDKLVHGVLQDEAGAWAALNHQFYLLDEPRVAGNLCLAFFQHYGVPPKILASILKGAWLSGKRVNSLRSIGLAYPKIAAMFDRVSPKYLNLDDLRRLPDEITVWRGGFDISARKLANGMSWSLACKRAIWFARRWVDNPYDPATNPLCVQGRVSKVDVLAYFGGSEEEVVVRSGRVRDIVTIIPGLPPSVPPAGSG
jgi:hypothetical protein